MISQISKIDRKEIAYIFLGDIFFQIIDSPKIKTIFFSIENFQIDNEISYSTIFPVILRTKRNKKQNKHAIDLYLVINKNTRGVVFIEELNMSICETQLKVDDELLKVFFKYFRDITSFSNSVAIETQTPLSEQVVQNPRNTAKVALSVLDVSTTKKRNSFKDDQKFIKEYDKLSGFVSVNYKMRDSKVNQFSFGNRNIPTEDQIEDGWEKVNIKERATNIYIKSLEASETDVSFIAKLSSDVQNVSDQMVRDRNYF